MSRSDNWMPLYIADYLADTMRLSTLEHGAYLLLLMEYWRQGPLPDDDRELAAICRLDRKTWQRDVAPAVRRFFSKADDGLLHQKRIDAERARAAELSAKRREAGSKGGRKSGRDDTQGDSNSEPKEEQLLSQLPPHARVASPSPSPPSLRSGPLPPVEARAKAPEIALPEWLPAQAWNDFVAMRKASRKPFTHRAAELILLDLEKLRASGHDPERVLNASTTNGWLGVFPLKRGTPGRDPMAELMAEMSRDGASSDTEPTAEQPLLRLVQ